MCIKLDNTPKDPNNTPKPDYIGLLAMSATFVVILLCGIYHNDIKGIGNPHKHTTIKHGH